MTAATALADAPADQFGEPDPIDALTEAERVLRRAGITEIADLLSAARASAARYGALVDFAARGNASSCRERRDDAYARLAMLLLARHPSVNARAMAIERTLRRYQASTWRQDRRAGVGALPANDIERHAKFDVLASGAPLLGITALRQLIGKQRG